MDTETLRAKVGAIDWYHSMDLGHGVTTSGVSDPRRSVRRLKLPDLHGKSVLDIGAWDGFFSFEAERRGAARVLATDSFSWGGGGWGRKDGFELARSALGSRVEDRTVDVLDLSPEAVGTFDVVFFLGVLYHMRHPMLALEHVFSVTKDLLVLETEVDRMLTRVPAAAFYPDVELNADPTNWWGPNPAAVIGMLRAVGFARAELVWRRPLAGRAAKWGYRAVRGRPESFVRSLQNDRCVFHAWRG